MQFVYPQDVLPEMGYSVPKPDHCCGSCEHSHVTNAGAVTPGFHCRLMEKMFRDAGIENGNDCVNRRFGSCKLHTALMAEVRPDVDVGSFPEDEVLEVADAAKSAGNMK